MQGFPDLCSKGLQLNWIGWEIGHIKFRNACLVTLKLKFSGVDLFSVRVVNIQGPLTLLTFFFFSFITQVSKLRLPNPEEWRTYGDTYSIKWLNERLTIALNWTSVSSLQGQSSATSVKFTLTLPNFNLFQVWYTVSYKYPEIREIDLIGK